MRIGSLCSGYGGLDMAVEAFFGATPAWFCEFDDAPSRILAHHWPDVPNHRDITVVDWSTVEPVDILAGGTPCQDLSHAGKRAGLRAGTRSGIWSSMCDAIETIRPRIVVWENVRGALSAGADSAMEPCAFCMGDGSGQHLRALGRVLGDLSELGFDARWGVVRASDAGAAHGRARVFVVATNSRSGQLARTAVEHDGLQLTPERRREPATDATGTERRTTQPNNLGAIVGSAAELGERACATADAGRERHGGRQNPRSVGRVDRTHADQTRQRQRSREVIEHRSSTDWGIYGPAITRWEYVLGRPAPAPTELGENGKPRLAPPFVEWLMGLPAGHVTDDAIGLTRNQQLKALGNGVVPEQAALALGLLTGPCHVAANEVETVT